MQVTTARTIEPRQRNSVEFVLQPAQTEGLLNDGWIVWKLMDTGIKENKVSEKLSCTVGACVQCNFNDDFTPDIHELVAVAVVDMSLSASFRSWPAS